MVFLFPLLALVLFPLLGPYTNITYCKCVNPIDLFMESCMIDIDLDIDYRDRNYLIR